MTVNPGVTLVNISNSGRDGAVYGSGTHGAGVGSILLRCLNW